MKTNAMRILETHNIPYTVKPHTKEAYTVEEAANERGVRVSQIVKTMLLKKQDGGYCIVLLPGHKKLNTKKVSLFLGGGKIRLAEREDVTKVTGYIVGAVSPIGIKNKSVQIYLDQEILQEDNVDISSGDLKIGIELNSSDLLKLLDAKISDFSD